MRRSASWFIFVEVSIYFSFKERTGTMEKTKKWTEWTRDQELAALWLKQQGKSYKQIRFHPYFRGKGKTAVAVCSRVNNPQFYTKGTKLSSCPVDLERFMMNFGEQMKMVRSHRVKGNKKMSLFHSLTRAGSLKPNTVIQKSEQEIILDTVKELAKSLQKSTSVVVSGKRYDANIDAFGEVQTRYVTNGQDSRVTTVSRVAEEVSRKHRWTSEEEASLKSFLKNGLTFDQMSSEHSDVFKGRSAKAISLHLCRMKNK